jgi:hypothetical protein
LRRRSWFALALVATAAPAYLSVVTGGAMVAPRARLRRQAEIVSASRFCPQRVQDVYVPKGARPVVPAGDVHSDSAELGRPFCWVNVARFFKSGSLSRQLSQAYPQWVDVRRGRGADAVSRVTGVVEGANAASGGSEWPHVSPEEWPLSHDTHDFTFHLLPDADGTSILGWQVPMRFEDPCAKARARFNQARAKQAPAEPLAAKLARPSCAMRRVFSPRRLSRQRSIEVEWESGLAADNPGNPCVQADEAGNSCGFYSAGHERGQLIWNWPVAGDRVTVVGQWIWDRGHPPAHSEIHPPRLVTVQRHLPVWIDAQTVLATEVDVLASGDGDAVMNNRPGGPAWVRRVDMRARDYAFTVTPVIPRPSPTAQLRWRVETRPGDSFPTAPEITPAQDGNSLRVVIPWHTRQAPNSSVFARSIFAYWDENHGYPADYRFRAYKLTLDHVRVLNKHDPGFDDGEYRLFVAVGAQYLFANETTTSGVLHSGLGETGSNQDWPLLDRSEAGSPHYSFLLVVPRDDRYGFAMHAGGWEADGTDAAYGHLVNLNHRLDPDLIKLIADRVLNPGTVSHGCNDDPIGEINLLTRADDLPPGFNGDLVQTSSGPLTKDPPCGTIDPSASFSLYYHVQELANTESARSAHGQLRRSRHSLSTP